MSDNTENKGKLEQFHLRGRNYDAVVRQLVEKYNASEGWAVVRVVPSILSLDVYLERNAEQGTGKSATKPAATKPAATKPAESKAVEPKVETKAKVDVEVVDEEEKQTVAKKAATTNKTAAKK